jgi:hypothetical protein
MSRILKLLHICWWNDEKLFTTDHNSSLCEWQHEKNHVKSAGLRVTQSGTSRHELTNSNSGLYG